MLVTRLQEMLEENSRVADCLRRHSELNQSVSLGINSSSSPVPGPPPSDGTHGTNQERLNDSVDGERVSERGDDYRQRDFSAANPPHLLICPLYKKKTQREESMWRSPNHDGEPVVISTNETIAGLRLTQWAWK